MIETLFYTNICIWPSLFYNILKYFIYILKAYFLIKILYLPYSICVEFAVGTDMCLLIRTERKEIFHA